MSNYLILKKIVHYGFTIFTILVLITGFGITQYQTVEYLTAGLLSKALSFTLHIYLEIPVIAFLILHIYLTVVHPRLVKTE
jgi:thiosulfate reductase cytochrome b subunit